MYRFSLSSQMTPKFIKSIKVLFHEINKPVQNIVMYTIVSVHLLSFTVLSLYDGLQQQSDSIEVIMKQLLALLNKEVVNSFRPSTEYFNFFQMLCSQVSTVFCIIFTI